MEFDPDTDDWQANDSIPYIQITGPDNFHSTWTTADQVGLPIDDPIVAPSMEEFQLDDTSDFDNEIYDSIIDNYHLFRTHQTQTAIQTIYTIRLPLFSSLIFQRLFHYLRAIFLDQERKGVLQYKLNFSFSFLLARGAEDAEGDGDNRIKAFIANSNSYNYLTRPALVFDTASLDQVLEAINENDIIESCSLLRDGSQWHFLSYLSLVVFCARVNDDNYNAGLTDLKSKDLPPYILRNPNVLTLLGNDSRPISNQSGLCFFRAYASFLHPDKQHLETETKQLFNAYQDFLVAKNLRQSKTPIKQFPGIRLVDLLRVEQCFQIRVQVWAYEERSTPHPARTSSVDDVIAKIIRRPLDTAGISAASTMHLLSYSSHFMLVKNSSRLAKCFACISCQATFPTGAKLNKHLRATKDGDPCVKGIPRQRFHGGACGRKITIFDHLSAHLGIFIPDSKRWFPWRCTFDFETLSPKRTNDSASDRYRTLGMDSSIDVRLCRRYRSPGWTADHESKSDYVPLNLGDRLSDFLFKHWNRFRSDHSKKDRLVIRLCTPPKSEQDVTMGRTANGTLFIENEETTIFKPTAALRETLLCALTLVSRETRSDVKRLNFSLILCNESPECDYSIVESSLFFDEAIDILEWECAYDILESSLRESDLDAFLLGCLKGEGESFVGVLGVKIEFKSQRLVLLYELVPLSVAADCNFPGFEAQFWVNTNEDDPTAGAQEIVEHFIDFLFAISARVKRLMAKRLRPYFKQIREKLRFYQALQKPYVEASRSAQDTRKGRKKLTKRELAMQVETLLLAKGYDVGAIENMRLAEKTESIIRGLWKQLQEYISQMPTIGFNSSAFDLMLIKRYLLPSLIKRYEQPPWNSVKRGRHCHSPISAITRHQAIQALYCPNLVFLDARCFYEPNVNYDKFLKAHEVPTEKLWFPHDYVTLARLKDERLPPMSAFDSWLKKSKMDEETYSKIVAFWNEHKIENLGGLLAYYNKADVTGLSQCLNKMFHYWTTEASLDPFKGFISLSESFLEYYCFFFGPSIVFNRYQERGVTTVPSGEETSTIFGLDCNSLYPSVLMQPLPCGYGIRYRPISTHPLSAPEHPPTDVATATSNTETTQLAIGDSAASRCSESPPDSADPELLLDELLDVFELEDDGQHSSASDDRDQLDATVFKGQPTEKYWRGSTEYLAWRTNQFRSSGQCHDHEPISKAFCGREMRMGPLMLAVDSYCNKCRVIESYQGCWFHGDYETCKNPRIRKQFEALSEDAKIDWMARAERTRRVDEYFTTNALFSNRTYSVMKECHFLAMKGQLRSTDPKEQQELSDLRNEQLIEFCKDRFPQLPRRFNRMTGRQLLQSIIDGDWTGFITCSVRVKDEHREYFSNFPPIYCHKDIGREDLCPTMKEYVMKNDLLKRPQRLLVSVLGAEKITILSTYLRHLLIDCSAEVLEISDAIYYSFRPILRDYLMNNLEQRIVAQQANQMSRSSAKKLESNSLYGYTCMNKEKHEEVWITDAKTALKLTSNPRYRHTSSIDRHQFYEVYLAKRSISMNIPIQLAISCLNLAKIEMNSFVHQFLFRFFKNRIQLIFIDTDSAFFSGSEATLDAHVDENDRAEYELAKDSRLALKPEHKYEPLRWKMELDDGVCCIACNSKCYCILRENGVFIWKGKGTQKSTNSLAVQHFFDAVFNQEATIVENRSFRFCKEHAAMFSAKVARKGVTFLYTKRCVTPTGVHTYALDLQP